MIDSFETWWLGEAKERVFSIFDKKDKRECIYPMSIGKIVEIVKLPNNDIMIGVRAWDDIINRFFEPKLIEYYLLSEVKLMYSERQ